jgi:signal transduction histidine kinase
MRNSLLWKLTLAFMLVAIITAALVAVFIRLTSVERLSSLIIDQQRSNLKTALIEYYSRNHSWDGLPEAWDDIHRRVAPPPPTPPPDERAFFEEAPRDFPRPNFGFDFFGLADAQGKVIIPMSPNTPAGSDVPAEILKDGTAMTLDGVLIGTILNVPFKPRFNPAENMFLQRTNEALLLAVLGALLFTLILGLLLARTLIHPIQALTRAAHNITMGDLEQEVKVDSTDEIGQLADAFNKMSREVARVNNLRRRMTADIAHDLRTPLTVIAGYVESMQDGVLEPTPARLSIIYAEIERLQNLVGDLRMLSQVDAGELPLNLQSISPRDLLDRALATFIPQIEMKGISISTNCPETIPNIRVDEARMMQVFSNLLSNALRYTASGGEISLSAESDHDKVILTIKDNGSGISEEDLPNIFDRLYRGDKSRSQSDETGLGLAIAKGLVLAHGGTIWAESEVGQYAAFHIVLPVYIKYVDRVEIS